MPWVSPVPYVHVRGMHHFTSQHKCKSSIFGSKVMVEIVPCSLLCNSNNHVGSLCFPIQPNCPSFEEILFSCLFLLYNYTGGANEVSNTRSTTTWLPTSTQWERGTEPLTTDKAATEWPGIFFKYDMSPLMVEVLETRRPLWQFLIRLCGIVGGIFATSGMLNSFVGSLTDGVLSCLLRGKGQSSSTSD